MTTVRVSKNDIKITLCDEHEPKGVWFFVENMLTEEYLEFFLDNEHLTSLLHAFDQVASNVMASYVTSKILKSVARVE